VTAHFVEMCEYGIVHAQCRCPSKDKTVHTIKCNVPEAHLEKALETPPPTEKAPDDMIGHGDIENRFTYHPPSDERAVKHIMIREHGKALAHYLDENVPAGREKELAIQRIEEAVMWANAGLARSPE